MDAEGEMDGGEDQAAPVKVDDETLKEAVAGGVSAAVSAVGFTDVSARWGMGDVNQQDVVGMGGVMGRASAPGVGVELSSQAGGGRSISTGDYSHMEVHEMDVVLMNGAIDADEAAGQSFESVGQPPNLTKERSEELDGALGRYVMECSPGRDEFVVNEVDCLKNDFEADNDFGFQHQRAESEAATEYENFVRSEQQAFEASQGPYPVEEEGEGLQFQLLLADSEADDDPDLPQYNQVELPEAAPSSGVDESLFYGQVFEAAGRENTALLSEDLDKGLLCRQEVVENQVVDTSDYVVECEGEPHFEPGSFSQSLLCHVGNGSVSKFEEAVVAHHHVMGIVPGRGEPKSFDGARHDVTGIIPGCDEPKTVDSLTPATNMVLLSQEDDGGPKPEEIVDHRVTSQEVVGQAVEPIDALVQGAFSGDYVADEQSVEMSLDASARDSEVGKGVQAIESFSLAERDMKLDSALDSSHFAEDGVEAMHSGDCPAGSEEGANGNAEMLGNEVTEASDDGNVIEDDNNDVSEGFCSMSIRVENLENSVDIEGGTKDVGMIEQVAQSPQFQAALSWCKLEAGAMEQPDNGQQLATSPEVSIGRETLTQDYEAVANHDELPTQEAKVCRASGVVLEQKRGVMRVDESSPPALVVEGAVVKQELVANDTESLHSTLCHVEPMGKADFEHIPEATEENFVIVSSDEPRAETGDVVVGVEGTLPNCLQFSEQSAQFVESADGSGLNPVEDSDGLLKVASKDDVNNRVSENVKYDNASHELEGTLGIEPGSTNLGIPGSSRAETASFGAQRLVDVNGGEMVVSVRMDTSGNYQPVALFEDLKSSQVFVHVDARKDSDICCELGSESQSTVHKDVEDSRQLQPTEETKVDKIKLLVESLVKECESETVTEPALRNNEAVPFSEQSATPMMEDKVQPSNMDVELVQYNLDDNDLSKKVEISEPVSKAEQIKSGGETPESSGNRKARDDTKSKSAQQETVGVPLWVKWRGKWQPGIQCQTIDCPPATLKAKPSYSKKHYIVVYSPTARNYSWVDIQHTLPISEDPMPLFSGTHESGRETVNDVFITRRRMLLKLGGEMLDISDRLHVKAVVESSRNVNVWKSFATEAAAATTYAQLGTLLVSLHLAIVREYIKPTWMMKRHALWKEECVRAESAASVQKLTKELINAVLWDDVAPLWNEPDQPELDPQWSNWKGEAFEEKEEPDTDTDAKAGPSDKDGGGEKASGGSGSSKRFKEQARARRQRPRSSEGLESTPLKRSKHNPRNSEGGDVSRAITAFRSPLVHPSGLLQNQPNVPVLEADRCHEVISADTLANLNGQLALTNTESNTQSLGSGDLTLALASSSAGYQSDGSEGDESKVFERIGRSAAASMAEGLIALESGLCSAYLKNKGRRCNRFSKKEGVKYCERHSYLVDPESGVKKVSTEGNMAWQSGLCSAFLRRENRRCARQAKEGFNGYCGFHVHLGTSDSGRNGEDGEKGEDGGAVANSVKEDRCQGITTRGVQCTHRTKDGSSYCVKHSLKGASQVEKDKDENKGQTSGASKMDWQNGTEPVTSVGTEGQADQSDGQHEPASEAGSQEGGVVRTLELKSFEHSRGSGEGSTRKRKALSSFFTDRAVGDPRSSSQPGQAEPSALSPKFTDGRAGQWTQCKGLTTRNEEQCSFRAREGQEYCSKHLNAMEAKKKITFQRSLRKEEVLNTDAKGSTSFQMARSLLHRFLKGVGGTSSQSSGSDAGNQLVVSTRLEAAKDGTAEELIKLVTMEMTKLQTFLHPVDTVEGKKADVNPAMGFAGSSSHFVVKALEGPVSNCEPSLLGGVLADDRKIADGRPVSCGLCDVEFPAVPDLGRHWELVHKKEVCLFVKGHACRVCDRLYTRKQTVATHWKKRHQSIEMTCPDLSVCFACDVRFPEDDYLLNHVIAMHPYQLSSPSLKEMIAQNRAIIGAEQEVTESLKCRDCSEEFDTHLNLFQHFERVHKRSENEGNGVKLPNSGDMKPGESSEVGSQSNGKYVCRLCGMNFPMLPDLGRHHQAAHMLCNKGGPIRGSSSSKKETAFIDSGRMKLPIRRKGDDKSAASEPSFGPTRRKRKKLRFTPASQRKSYEKDAKGPDSLRLHVQAVLQGATLRKRHKKQADELSTEPAGDDPSLLTKPDFSLPRESVSNSITLSPNDGILALAHTAPNNLSLTRRVESNFESVQEKFKLQADKIFTDFSQLHGESSVKHESHADEPFYPVDSVKSSVSKVPFKQDQELEALKDIKTERSKLPQISSSSPQEQQRLDENSKKRPKFIVTCEDLSGGQEPVPIVCVIDQDVLSQMRTFTSKESGGKDVYQPSSFTYITKRRLDPSLGLVPENYKIGCTCGKEQCTPNACEHVNLFDCDNAEACDIYSKPMRGRFPYDDQGCIILEEGYLVYECNSSCPCQLTCHNRVLQKGVTVKLEVFKTQYKGWAVRAAQKISRGTFVCEYVGEVLHDQEANKRGERYDQVGCSYLYDIDAHLDISGTGRRSKPFVIDATSQGNVARFINHSCAPNLVNYQVLVESMDAQLAHIGLFASRDIEIGEELAYDYRYRLLPGKGCPCHCGAKNCRGRLY